MRPTTKSAIRRARRWRERLRAGEVELPDDTFDWLGASGVLPPDLCLDSRNQIQMTGTSIKLPFGLTARLRAFAQKAGALTESSDEFFRSRGWMVQQGLIVILPELGGIPTQKVHAHVFVLTAAQSKRLQELLSADSGAVEHSEPATGDS